MKSELRKGATYNYLNLLLVNATGLVLTPFIIRCLGPSQYGLYLLAGAIVPYLTLLDFGLGKTTTRYVAYYRERGDEEGLRACLASIFRLCVLLCAVLLAAGASLYFLAPQLWGSHFDSEEVASMRRMIAVIAVTQAFIIPGNIFTAICNGCGLFAFPRGIQPIKYTLRAVCIGLLLWHGEKALALICVDAALNIGVVIATCLYVRRRIVWPSLREAATMPLNHILPYAFWIAIYQATAAFQWNTGQIVAGMTHDSLAVGVAGVGILLGCMYGYFAETINRMLLPRATHTVCLHADKRLVTDEMIRMGRMVLLPQSFILGGFVIFGGSFVRLWAGDMYGQAYPIALAIMASWTVQLTGDYGNSLLEAHGKVRTLSVINFICIFAAAIASYYASWQWGLGGMTAALCCGTIAATIANHIYYRKRLGVESGRYFKAVYMRIIVATVVTAALGRMVWEPFAASCNWIGLATGCAAYALIYASASYFIALTQQEREKLRTLCLRK